MEKGPWDDSPPLGFKPNAQRSDRLSFWLMLERVEDATYPS